VIAHHYITRAAIPCIQTPISDLLSNKAVHWRYIILIITCHQHINPTEPDIKLNGPVYVTFLHIDRQQRCSRTLYDFEKDGMTLFIVRVVNKNTST
jgi:hypothetical protein